MKKIKVEQTESFDLTNGRLNSVFCLIFSMGFVVKNCQLLPEISVICIFIVPESTKTFASCFGPYN